MQNWKIIKDWTTEAGLRACCIISSRGNINGYVEVPDDSPFSEMEYYVYSVNIEKLKDWTEAKRHVQEYINSIEVHGGLTFSRKSDGKYLPGENWWFGFDTAHAGDSSNVELAWELLKEDGDDRAEFIKNNNYMTNFADDTYKDLQYVERQCESLARQLTKTCKSFVA